MSQSSRSSKTRRSRYKKRNQTPPGSTNTPPVVETVEEESKSVTTMHSQGSQTSSILESVTSTKMNELFPPGNTISSFAQHPELVLFLSKDLGLTQPMIDRLCAMGVTSPSALVNAFGLSEDIVIQSYLKLGYKYMERSNSLEAKACTKLFMFARGVTL